MNQATKQRVRDNRWVLGARLRTLPAAIVPVVVGTAGAAHDGHVVVWHAAAALVVALGIQVGTNYANDYADGIKGTDTVRVGPVRLVATGLASPKSVKTAAFTAFFIAAVVGTVLSIAVQPWLLVVGAACISAGWYYTGGARPYGYRGLGELSVFVFFGLVATVGSAYVQTKKVTAVELLAAVAVGSLAVALLVVNNLRDRQNDAFCGKRTLAVRLGDAKTRWFYMATLAVPFIVVITLGFVGRPVALVALPAAVSAWPLIERVRKGETGRGLIGVLQGTGKLQLVFGALLALGLAL